MNQCIFEGQFTTGKFGGLKYSKTGAPYLNFSVKIEEEYEKNGEQQQNTQYVKCVAFSKVALEFGQLAEGTTVRVEGKWGTSSYDGKDGKKVYDTSVTVFKIESKGGQTTVTSGPVATGSSPEAASKNLQGATGQAKDPNINPEPIAEGAPAKKKEEVGEDESDVPF